MKGTTSRLDEAKVFKGDDKARDTIRLSVNESEKNLSALEDLTGDVEMFLFGTGNDGPACDDDKATNNVADEVKSVRRRLISLRERWVEIRNGIDDRPVMRDEKE